MNRRASAQALRTGVDELHETGQATQGMQGPKCEESESGCHWPADRSRCTREQVLADYPDLEPQDVQQALEYAAWLAQEKVRAV